MGHYQKKPYKKHTLDPYNDIDIEREYLDALNDDEDLFDEDNNFDLQETRLLDEPDIIRQLRQEELEGRLPMYLLDLSENIMTRMTTTPLLHDDSTTVDDTKHPRSYHECYEIAKKTLKKLSNNIDDTIKFE